MSFVLPQIALQRILKSGLAYIKANPETIDDIFGYYSIEELSSSYGTRYIDKIKQWIDKSNIPVVQAWSFDSTNIPGISIKLSQESEDISKAPFGDLGYFGENEEVGVGVMQVNLDIGIHASKSSDEVLWLYYIALYILYKFKINSEGFGLEVYTFSATDHQRNDQYLTDNIWTRWIRFSTTVQNTWCGDDYIEISGLDVDMDVSTPLEDETVDL